MQRDCLNLAKICVTSAIDELCILVLGILQGQQSKVAFFAFAKRQNECENDFRHHSVISTNMNSSRLTHHELPHGFVSSNGTLDPKVGKRWHRKKEA